MVHLWIIYCRNILEQSCTVWNSSLTEENVDDLERTQKVFAKLTLQNEYTDYTNALLKLNLLPLSERRKMLAVRFYEKSIQNKTLDDLFPLKEKEHMMKTRKEEKFQVVNSTKERLKKSSVVNMQSELNKKKNKT